MRILVLDDSKERMKHFGLLIPSKHELWYAYESQDAIDLLDTLKFDAVFLDHDLNHLAFAPSDEKSGYAVACYLEEYQERQPEFIIIHSLNPIGARKMNQALPEAVHLPFVWMGYHNHKLERMGIL